MVTYLFSVIKKSTYLSKSFDDFFSDDMPSLIGSESCLIMVDLWLSYETSLQDPQHSSETWRNTISFILSSADCDNKDGILKRIIMLFKPLRKYLEPFQKLQEYTFAKVHSLDHLSDSDWETIATALLAEGKQIK